MPIGEEAVGKTVARLDAIKSLEETIRLATLACSLCTSGAECMADCRLIRLAHFYNISRPMNMSMMEALNANRQNVRL